jgi:hypothetical protein
MPTFLDDLLRRHPLPPNGGVAPASRTRSGEGTFAFSVPIPAGGGGGPDVVLLEGQAQPVFSGFISGTGSQKTSTLVYRAAAVPDGVGYATIIINPATLEPLNGGNPGLTGSLSLEARVRSEGVITSAEGVQFRSQLTVIGGSGAFRRVTGAGVVVGRNIQAGGQRNISATYWLRLVWPA